MKIINSILLFLFININQFSSYIVIPFKTFQNSKLSKSINLAEDFLQRHINNTIYIEIEAGLPSQKLPALILSKEYGFSIINQKCIVPSSFDTIEKSKTFSKLESINEYKFNYMIKSNIIMGKDIFNFPTESSSRKQALLNFIYSPNEKDIKPNKEENSELYFSNNKNGNYTCACIGISGSNNLNKYYEKNLINQLYNENIIENNYFSIIFSTDSNEEGIFLIGVEPHEHDKENYFEPQLTLIKNEENNFFSYWSLFPDKIYFKNNNQIYNITDNLICTLEYNLGVIFGTQDYLKLIKEQFFKTLLGQNKCHEEIVYSVYTIFYCDNKKDIEIFPTLNFYLDKISFTFELNYKDLFFEEKNKYFFKIIFDRNNNQWKLGKPFLQKYVFVYDYDSKDIGFYNNNISKESKVKKLIKIIINISVIVGILLFLYCVGVFYGIKIYNKAVVAEEVENEDEYKYKKREKRSLNYSYIEMMVESKVIEE